MHTIVYCTMICKQKKERELCLVFNEKVKGPLIRSRFMSLAEMDAPTSFF